MPTYYAELTGGTIKARETFSGGTIYSTGGATVIQNIKSAAATPSSLSQHISITPDVGYDAMGEVQLTVDAIPPEYVIPTGTKTITTNGTHDVASYQNAFVNVSGGGGATLETKSVSYTPSESAISDTLLPDVGYDGFSEVDVSVDAIPSNYVGSGITQRTSSDLTASGATVTAPAGYYENAASKAIPNASVEISAPTVNNDGSVNVDLGVTSGGYIATGAYSLTTDDYLNVQAAQTIYPSASDQSIASGKYLTGAQTIKGVTYTNLTAENIKKDVVVQVGDSADPDRIVSVTGTYEGGGGGSGMALSDFLARTLRNEDRAVVLTGNTADFIKQMFFRWTNITSFKSLSSSASIGNATYCFANCTDLKTIVLPNITAQTMSSSSIYFAEQSTALEAVDVSFGFYNYSFNGCSSLDTVVLRRSGVATLGNINAFNGTPFASGGTGGTLYVPNDLLASYQSASNWSTILGYANNQIKSIESTHTDPTAPIDLTLYYADGTAI